MATVLVAEDEEAIRKLVALILRSEGHRVFTASNGVEAVSLFRYSPDRFDLVITDLKMPVMDGHQVIKLILESKPGPRIICMTGYTEKSIPPGVELLEKPFSPAALRASVTKVLGSGPAGPAPVV
jgi:CheY-like chemotaxis protein